MASQALYVLFEHAIGYSLFRVKEFYEVEQLKTEVENSVLDLSRFNSIVKLEAFSSFKNAKNSLDNMNAISEGIIHEDLKEFITSNVPASTKKQKVVLGVSDSKLSAAIKDELGVKCLLSDSVREIVRGLRLHAPKLIRNLTDVMQGKAQASLALNYSRSKVKFNINREDNMVIQGIGCLDQKDKEINTMSMQLRNWYSDCFPELKHIIPDNRMYFQVMQYIGDRKSLTEDRLPGLEEIVMDSAKAKAIYNAARSSIGMDVAQVDLINISNLADRLLKSYDNRKSLQDYLHSKMGNVAPNLSELIGDQVGARLISHAGSLTNLAKCAASTVQILGAEKALFRALKTKGNTPKYGLIFHSSFISRAALKNKGRISRNLANKCSLAARIDCFSDIPSSVYGAHLKELVEERLKFYESGETPRKNCDVMELAANEAAELQKAQAKREKKKKRKSKGDNETEEKRAKLDDEMELSLNKSVADEDGVEQKSHEKKKKKKKADGLANDSVTSLNDTTPMSGVEEGQTDEKKKKKKRKSEGVADEESSFVLDRSMNVSGTENCASEEKKKKKKKDKTVE